MFFITLINACKKDEKQNTIVIGTITEKGSGKPLQGAIVFLGREEKGTFGASATQTVQSITTGADGKYSIEYKEDENYRYLIKVRNPPYFESAYYYPTSGQNNIYNIALAAPGYVRFHAKNISGADKLAIGDPCYFDCSYYGSSVDTMTRAFTIESSVNTQIVYLVYKFNVDTTKYTDNLSIAPFDTITYDINY